MTKNKKCVCCEQECFEDEVIFSDDNEPLCETCFYEAEPIATVVYSDDTGEYPLEEGVGSKDLITRYRNDTDFKVEWESSDAWRGYYEVVESGSWSKVHDDCILAHSEDERHLKSFDEELEDFCTDKGISFVKVFCRTSNCFSSGYDFFVPDQNVIDVEEFVKNLKEKHRDLTRFNETALTGKDPKDITKHDKDFVLGANLVKGGSTPEEAVKTVKTLSKE